MNIFKQLFSLDEINIWIFKIGRKGKKWYF